MLANARFLVGVLLVAVGGLYVVISGIGYFVAAWGFLGLLLLLAVPFWLPVAPLVPWLLTGAVSQLFVIAWAALWAGALVSGVIGPKDIWNAVVHGKA